MRRSISNQHTLGTHIKTTHFNFERHVFPKEYTFEVERHVCQINAYLNYTLDFNDLRVKTHESALIKPGDDFWPLKRYKKKFGNPHTAKNGS